MNQARLEPYSLFLQKVFYGASDVFSNRQHRFSANTLASVLLSPKVKDCQSLVTVSALLGAYTLASVLFSPKVKDRHSLATTSALFVLTPLDRCYFAHKLRIFSP